MPLPATPFCSTLTEGRDLIASGLGPTTVMGISVKSRLFINAFDKQFRLFFLPALQSLDGALMVQGTLGDVVVVGRQVVGESGVEVGGAGEAGLLDQVADSAVEAFDHAVGLRMPGRAQAVLDAHGQASHIEHVLARGRPGFAGEAVGELTAVVGEDVLDFHGCDAFEATQEVDAAVLGLIAVAAHVDPPRGPVDGNEQVAPMGLVGHLRQVLDVDVQEARLVVLEGLERLDLALDLGLKAFEVGDLMAAQATIEPRPRDLGVDELPGEGQQVIQGQQQHAAQLDDEQFLADAQGGSQGVRAMRPVLRVVASLPLAGGGNADVVALGEFGVGVCRGPHFSARAGGGSGNRMNLAHGA